MLRGVIGNTSDSGSEESRFEPWRSNYDAGSLAGIFVLRQQGEKFTPLKPAEAGSPGGATTMPVL